MTASIRAELRRLARWPALWVLCGTWLVLNLMFGYVFTYLTYRSDNGTGFGGGGTRAVMLAQMMPAEAPITLVQGMPMFGGALLMILGALAVGSGYGWGTWKTVFTTGPRRTTALGGTFAAIAAMVTALIMLTLGLDLAASFVVAAAENQAVGWPTLLVLVQGLGS